MGTEEGQHEKRSGIRIYRAVDAPDLTQTDFIAKNDFGEHDELKDVVAALGAAATTTSRLLVRQKRQEGGFSLLYLSFKPNFPLFRHTHESDCLYVVISGSAIMGNQTLRPGDSFFVPAYAPYFYTAGPEGVEVLEIRHNVDSVTVIFTHNPQSRLAEVEAAIEKNAESWKTLGLGPLLRANGAVLPEGAPPRA